MIKFRTKVKFYIFIPNLELCKVQLMNNTIA